MDNLLQKSIQEYQTSQNLVSELKKYSDQIRRGAKKAIALLRRDNLKGSGQIIQAIEGLFKENGKLFRKNQDLDRAGFYREAIEEYIEAKVFFNFLSRAAFKVPNFIKAKPEEIIGGFCDFTGELVRKAITLAGLRDQEKILDYKKVIEEVAEELTKIGLEGKLRQKYDETERNLRRIEDILYDLRVRKF